MKTIFYDGVFLTMEDTAGGNGLAKAVLVEDGVIVSLGDKAQLMALAPDADMRSMNGNTVLPGFVDGHSHISAVAYQLLMANLKPSPMGPCDSVEDVVTELKAFLAKKTLGEGQWLLGMGYDNSVYADGQHPRKEDLDQVSTLVPIAAIHISGHLCVVNSKGMELMGYAGDHPVVPPGGVVESSGLLKEQAFLGSDLMGQPSMEDIFRSLGEASRLYASYGMTTVQDAKTMPEEMELLKAAGQQGLLVNDVVCYLAPPAADLMLPHTDPKENRYIDQIRMAGMKLFLDGSPQGKTAWLSSPYFKVPHGEREDYKGFPVQSEEYVLKMIRKSLENHWQINVHANGDEAIEQLIRCYSKALIDCKCLKGFRPVVIHAQTVRQDQLVRMKKIGMIVSFFLDHVYYWGDYHYESVLGPERAERISPLRMALDQGISFTMHQDSPVVPPDVLFSVHNAVNRKTKNGRMLGGDQRITVPEALKAVTICGAYQIFEEHRKGSLAAGKLADFVVLDQNPLDVPSEQLKDIKILETIKNGKTIFRKI